MEITFTVHYHTTWGENLYVFGDIKPLGNSHPSDGLQMQYTPNGDWTITISLPDSIHRFRYGYIVKKNNTIIAREWGKMRLFIRNATSKHYQIYDKWRICPSDSPFYTSLFYRNIFVRKCTDSKPIIETDVVTFRVYAPQIEPDETVVVTGNSSSLGQWDPEKAIVMDDTDFPLWQGRVACNDISQPLEYKYIIVKKETRQLVAWENGENRRIANLSLPSGTSTLLPCEEIRYTPIPWKGAGTVIPLFSLRSKESTGIGEFSDLRLMADWAALTGQRIIQILPVNDTTLTRTWLDSYPYNAVSVFALNPIYLRLEEIGILKDSQKATYYTNEGKRLNQLPQIDFEQVSSLKWNYFKEIYQEKGEQTLESEEFKQFFELNKTWLQPYALFCFLRDSYQTPDFQKWKTWNTFHPQKAEKMWQQSSRRYKEIAFYYFLQYHADKQLSKACSYARSIGVSIKGDIPIGISRHSTDAWTNPELFHLNSQAGAPPDDFAESGQNWGFPTYNWEEMAKDGYKWWRRRFEKMSSYFDAYRIDHILGFFRIWEIPMESVEGLLGYFNPALPYSKEEIEAFGFCFNEPKHTQPYITRSNIKQLFGKNYETIIHRYFVKTASGRFTFKPECNTQRKIEKLFSKTTDEKKLAIKKKLFGLVNEVLFIKDTKNPQRYHPRISAQKTQVYRALSTTDQICFNRLYEHFFYHRHNDFWEKEATKKLPPLISATDMLVCGEDLGMIPACVPNVMERFKILSLEIQRMPKQFGRWIADTTQYPYLSVCSTSTHDMTTLREWWEENRDNTQKYFSEILHLSGSAPRHAQTWICEKILDLHLQSPSMLAIIPLQDWLSMDSSIRKEDFQSERINIPANPKHYWKYRMHIYIEDLLENKLFNKRIKEMINVSGR